MVNQQESSIIVRTPKKICFKRMQQYGLVKYTNAKTKRVQIDLFYSLKF